MADELGCFAVTIPDLVPSTRQSISHAELQQALCKAQMLQIQLDDHTAMIAGLTNSLRQREDDVSHPQALECQQGEDKCTEGFY